MTKQLNTNPQSSSLNPQCTIIETTPLELLNLYLTDGKSKGDKTTKLYQKFNSELTWDAILNKGYQRDLAPLLYYIVNKDGLDSDSKEIALRHEIKHKLKAVYNQYLATNLIQFNELEKILNAFESEGIDVISLKGVEMAKNYYPDQALRPMGDIDLLIRKEDMKRAKECLISHGYGFKSMSTFVDEDFYERKHFHFPYIKYNATTPIVVELHQDIAGRSDFINNNIVEFWEKAAPIDDRHKSVLITAKEYLLLHLFWHTYLNLSNCLYVRLICLIDIALIMRKHKDDIDWDFIEEKSKEWAIYRQGYFCLYLINQLFDIPYDKKITRTIMPPKHCLRLFDFIMSQIECDIHALRDPNRLYIRLLILISLNTTNARIKYLFRYNPKASFSKRERLRKKYNLSSGKAVYIFYIIHPILSTLMGLKWLYKIFLRGGTDKLSV
ncbi:MAG: nucleotidyltransferase family protein [Desulfobacterales bacterium]|nr:nucleotidyltransferase family protein [Desulfobacterales bacterium]